MALENVCGLQPKSFSKSDILLKDSSKFKEDIDFLRKSHFSFQLLKGINPAQFWQPFPDKGGRQAQLRYAHGTTCLAFICQHGIIVAVDSRASAGGYIPWTDIMKIIEIDKYILGTMAGGAADCQFWIRFLRNEARVYQLRNKERLSVAGVSKTLVNMFHQYKGMGIITCNMVCGWDKRGANLFYVDSDGRRYPHHMVAVGSGASYAYGVLDNYYHYDMSQEEAYDMCRRAILAAAYRDIGSGGDVTLCHIREGGWTKVFTEDIMDVYDRFMKS